MWRKSTHSNPGGNCIEATNWRTSTRSDRTNCIETADWRTPSHSVGNQACVEVSSGAAVRDSKLGDDSPILAFDAASWTAFINRLTLHP
jgi:hypothetical protein